MSFTQRQEDDNLFKSGLRRSPPDLQLNWCKDPWVSGQGPHPACALIEEQSRGHTHAPTDEYILDLSNQDPCAHLS